MADHCCTAAFMSTHLQYLSLSCLCLKPRERDAAAVAMEIVYVYARRRCDFGRPCNFSDRPAELHVDVQPDPALAADFVRRDPCDVAVQCAQEMSEHEVGQNEAKTHTHNTFHTTSLPFSSVSYSLYSSISFMGKKLVWRCKSVKFKSV